MRGIKSIDNIFTPIDNKDIEGFLGFLEQNCLFRFGNLPAVNGVEDIMEFVSGFFDSIDSLEHKI